MKKLLVVLLSAALVLSLAAVSMAANVKGDFRYEMYEDETVADHSYAVTDLRVTVEGAISDSVSATGVFQLKHDPTNTDSTKRVTWDTNEYYVTYKQSWGSVKAGSYEYKFTPSRILLKSDGYHVWKKVDVLIATTINTPVEGLTADILWQPYAQATADEGNYGLTVAYKGENWGLQGSYASFKENNELVALDAYYMINDTMKVFVLGVDSDAGAVNDSFDPVVGFSWDKIAGSKWFAGIEYALDARNEGLASEFTEYTINVKYKFNNKVGLEIEHYQAGHDQLKDIFRMRYQF
jgi:methionine-rich copper-binding protein CopC